jgi:hypothetical protein
MTSEGRRPFRFFALGLMFFALACLLLVLLGPGSHGPINLPALLMGVFLPPPCFGLGLWSALQTERRGVNRGAIVNGIALVLYLVLIFIQPIAMWLKHLRG